MVDATPREMAFTICLSEAYELAGKRVADTTIMSAAKEMARRIPCSDNEIKELFAIARESADIPTIKNLWKAWDVINENRAPAPSTTLTYNAFERKMRKINYMITLSLFSMKIGRYADFCHAYDTQKTACGKYEYKNQAYKNSFDLDVLPFMEKVCGKWLGTNPYLPEHPVQKMRKMK